VVEFAISTTVGIAVAIVWMVIWKVALRAFGIPFLMRTPEARAVRQERIVRMGKLRYTLVFGVLGYGFGFALSITVAGLTAHDFVSWERATTKVLFLAVVGGCWYGFRTWNEFRGEIPFPPNYPPQN
jgi:hypothetical protein